MQEQTNVQAMQKYLRLQIIDKGYAPEDFMEYLMTQKTSGEDIANWDYEQLVAAVKVYKERLEQTSESMHDIEEPQLKVDESILSKFEVFGENQLTELIIEKEQRVEYEKTNLYDTPVTRTIDCVQYKGFLQDISKMNFDVLSYEIRNTKQIWFGLAKTTELWYTVRCSLINSTVNRLDSDFVWLRNTLIRIYPGRFIPPFDGVQDISSETDSSCKHRKQMANFFLKSLYDDEFLFNTKLVISFLTWSQYNRFSQFKSSYDSITFTKSLQATQHPQGRITIQISNKNTNTLKAAESFTHSLDHHYANLQEAIKNLQVQFRNSSNALYHLGSVFKQYNHSYTKYFNTVPECKNDSVANCLVTVTNSVFQWARTFKDYERSVCASLDNMLRYNKKEAEAAIDMLHRRNSWKSEYLKFKEALIKKKEKIFEDPYKWELPDVEKYKKLEKNQLMKCILPNETKEEEKMKLWLGYINKQTQIEIQRVFAMNTRRLAVYWTNYGVQNLQSTQDIHQIFKEISNGILLNMQKSSIIYE